MQKNIKGIIRTGKIPTAKSHVFSRTGSCFDDKIDLLLSFEKSSKEKQHAGKMNVFQEALTWMDDIYKV